MSEIVDQIVEKLSLLSPSEKVDVLEAAAARLGVESRIGRHNEERIRLAKECLLLEQEAWQFGVALAQITGLCENHYAKFRVRHMMRPEEEP